MDEKASHLYLVFYSDGSLKHPAHRNKKLEKSEKVMLGEMRLQLVRPKLIFNGIALQQNMGTTYAFTDKMYKKTKHKFDSWTFPAAPLV